MAERKAVNKWLPSDFDPVKHKSVNGYHKTHHLRERARKLDQGILIVRFELPFNIWCLGCNNHIGMGVRYNAEKKKVGDYYSTRIFEFRMKCHLCDNHFTIRTDPANLDYVVETGARRQDKRWNADDGDQIVLTDDKEKIDKLATDSMFKLEHLAEDKNKLLRLVPHLERLEDFQEERWKDDYSSNSDLRRIFRKRREELKLKEKEDQKLQAKCGSELIIEDEDPNDVRLSKLMKLNSSETPDEIRRKRRSDIMFDSIGLQSTVRSYVNSKNYKTPELKSIAKSIVRKNVDQLSRNNLRNSLVSVNRRTKSETDRGDVPGCSETSDEVKRATDNGDRSRGLVVGYSDSESD